MPKTIRNIYEQSISFEKLLMAHKKARRGKREKKEVILFELNLEREILRIEKDLREGKYKSGEYKIFKIYEPKERLIMASPYKDRVVHQWYVENFIKPYFVPQFISTSYAGIENRGMHKASKDVQKAMRIAKRNWNEYYILKMDVTKYFQNIDKRILWEILKKKIKDRKLLWLTRTILLSTDGMKYALRKGIITHNPAVGVKIPKGVVAKDYKTLHIDEQKTLTIEQLQILIQASMGTSIYLPILFSAIMGLRRGEVNGVKYSDVDFINRKLKLQRQLGIVANSKKEDYDVKTYTKQEIPLKTHSSYRELDIPDIVFEAILEERKKYEKNKRRRINDKTNPFQDLDYICCSSYGRSRSRTYCFPHFKKILKENNLPDIRWHDLRATYATILLKNDFSIKAISKRMGHSKQIITVDVYGDKKEIIKDCTEELMPFIEDILPTEEFILNDYTEETQNLIPYFDDLISEVTDEEITLNDYSDDIDTEDIFSDYGIAINM